MWITKHYVFIDPVPLSPESTILPCHTMGARMSLTMTHSVHSHVAASRMRAECERPSVQEWRSPHETLNTTATFEGASHLIGDAGTGQDQRLRQ